MLQNMLTRRSDKGEISIFDETDNFLDSFKAGKWIADDLFQYSNFDNFIVIVDEHEISRLAAEARAALGLPRSTKPKQSRTA